ncbi:pogo_transposable element with KRAB domain [Hexamita inflata]|uniref:Pogo transposable element with KRAB domain n=1 Tax=Hexamita inflata TaxID=28002 RepID=A0AA86PGF3_9EUKA|nr:pogo transposable element with KRAB domain [Hexamita inflata]
MSSNLFSSIGKEPSLNEQPDYSYTGVFTSVNTAQVQILQEEPQTPTVAPVQHVEPVQPTQPPVNRRIALRSTNKIRLSFSVDLKKKVIDYYKQMMKQCPCSALHLTRVFFAYEGITDFNIKNFMRQKNLTKIMETNESFAEKFKIKPRKSNYPTIEKKLLEFFEENVCVSLKDLRMEAFSIRDSLPLDSQERINFKGSDCYLHNFMERQCLSLQVPCSKKEALTPEMLAKVTGKYLQEIYDTIAEYDLQPHQILNCDETSICRMMSLPKFVGYINNKKQVGAAALKFFFQRYHQLPIDHPQAVYATGNQSGWMTYEAMYDYLTQVIYPYIKKYGHIILTLDNCSSHNIDKIKQKLREDYQTFISSGNNRVTFFEEFLVAMDTYCHVIYVPKNTTPQNQVLDVSVNGPFKAYLRGIHHQYCVEQHRILKNANSHLALTPEDKKIKIPAPSRIESYRQIMKAIALISPNVVIHGFEKIGILRTSTSTVPPTLYVSKGGHQIMGFAKFSYQKRIWTYCDNENNIGLDQILFPKDDIEDDDEDILNGLPMMPSQE